MAESSPAATEPRNARQARLALFASVEGGEDGTEGILSRRPLVTLFRSTAERSASLECIQSHKFHKGHARRFFSALESILRKLVEEEAYVPASAFETEALQEEDQNPRQVDPSDIEADAQSTEALLFVKAAARCLQAYVDGLIERRSDDDVSSNKQCPIIDEPFAVAEFLHELLFPLHSCGVEGLHVQSVIASLCETWWNNRLADRECMIVQLVPMLVAKSLEPDAPKTEVKRVFELREAMQVLDFEDDSIEYLRALLLRTVSSPNYLRQTEGRRFIAGLYRLHPSMVKDLHQAVRVQIPEAKKTILQAYGDIYFRAWRESEAASIVRGAIEETALQDLMYAVLHVQSSTMAKSIQTVLEPFHDAKKTPEVETLLHRMYGPILWRSLSAANPTVRLNASVVLCDTFPLQETTLDHRETERAVRKGTAALKSLLADSDARVRVAGSEATAAILATFWDVLPTTDIRILLNHIVAEHASDTSSSAVRSAALTSTTTLLDAEQSHAVLRPLLPSLGNLIHDKVERVRLAAVRLLLRVKQIKGIKYYHVVPVDHLTARLAEEGARARNGQGPVASALTELMLNSFFPQGNIVTGADQVKRTISFLSSDPAAASVFYSNLFRHLSVSSVAKLAAMLLRCLVSAVEVDKVRMAKKKGGRKRRRYGRQEEDTKEAETVDNEGALSASNTSVMASLAETICVLWESIESDLNDTQNEASNEFLFEAFSGAVLTNAHSHFDQKAAECDEDTEEGPFIREECHRTCAAVLRCAGRLPPKAVEGLASRISSKLSSLEDDVDADSVHESISPHVALLCLWGMTEDVACSLSIAIKTAFGFDDVHSPVFDEYVGNSKKRRSASSKLKQNLKVPVLPAPVAMAVVEDIFRGADPSSMAAREAILASPSACLAIEKALELGTVRAERLLQSMPARMDEDEVELVLKACEAYGRFALHKEASRGGRPSFNDQAEALLKWTTQRVVPVLLNVDYDTDTPLKDLNISRISTVDESLLHPSSPSPVPPPKQRANRNTTPERYADRSLTSTDKSITFDVGDEVSPAAVSHGAAVSLMLSSCAIFSEWLAVGGCGANAIAASVSKWCIIFSTNQFAAFHAELLPAFIRLIVELCKEGATPIILKSLLVHCSVVAAETEEFVLLKKTVSSLLVARDNKGVDLMAPTTAAALEAAHDLLEKNQHKAADAEESEALPDTIADLWATTDGSMIASFSAIFSNKHASLTLAEKIVDELSRHVDSKERNTYIALFHAKCLFLLCEHSAGRGTWDAKNALRALGIDEFEEESPVRDILQGVLGTHA